MSPCSSVTRKRHRQRVHINFEDLIGSWKEISLVWWVVVAFVLKIVLQETGESHRHLVPCGRFECLEQLMLFS